ncbi:MAG: 4-(cytidine 5'-diphospho)-2-C-methyl-D-erythritol kinase, partial [Candidatus Omnitrophota bacterium]
PKDNIVYKAALELIRLKKLDHGVKIVIKKHVPIAAGLGGGSSDAAAVIVGMNKLFKLGINDKDLMRIGSRLGSDVPFFILNTAFARGTRKGEKLSSIKSKARFWHLIINPGFHVATKDIYSSLDLALTRKKGGVKIHSLLKTMDFGMVEAMLHNDLEDTVVSKKGIIGSIIKRLATLLGKKAIVSGSGPSVFCLYRTRKEALKARELFLKRLPLGERRGWKIFVARTW